MNNSRTMWIALAAVIVLALGWFYMSPQTETPTTTPSVPTQPTK